MSVTSRSPLRVAGATINSGNPATGEVPVTRGGQRTFCVYSGALLLGSGGSTPIAGGTTGNALWWSGPGRLNTILTHQAVSGAAGFFYDSATIAASGVAAYAAAGYQVVGVVPANTFGVAGVVGGPPQQMNVDVPFANGLCGSFPSGMAGVTFTITPETNVPFN